MGVISLNLRLGSGCVPVDESLPIAEHPEKCIRCGHCVAVCPKAALDHEYAPLAEQVDVSRQTLPGMEAAAVFLRSRRSIRSYKERTPVPQETLARLLNIARYAPSGTNAQGLSYIVISDEERLCAVTKATVEWLEEKLDRPGSKLPPSFREPVDAFREGRDTLLRGAPHLIIALTPPELIAVSTESAKFALEYVELLAPAMGLGTCWMGLIGVCASKKYPPLMDALGVPDGRDVVGAMTAGYPKFRYPRLVERDPLDVTWI
jgi:nitroreductase